MNDPDDQGEDDDPEPLETVAMLFVVGFTVAALLTACDWLVFYNSFRRWW